MVNKQFNVKVGDFGTSRFNTETQKETLAKMRGTFAYCAPGNCAIVRINFGRGLLWGAIQYQIRCFLNIHRFVGISGSVHQAGVHETIPGVSPPTI